MKFRNILAIVIVLFSAGAATAQQPLNKIGLINSSAFFDEKAGVTKLVSANKQLLAEFLPVQNEIETLNKRLKTLATEIENLRKQPNPDQKLLQTKQDEGEQLQRSVKYKAEDAKDKYGRREAQVLGPLLNSVGTGLQEYAKTKGYALIFDAAKDQNGFLVAVGEQGVDVTKDFVTFYNAKP